MGLELEGPYRSWVSLISPLFFFSGKSKEAGGAGGAGGGGGGGLPLNENGEASGAQAWCCMRNGRCGWCCTPAREGWGWGGGGWGAAEVFLSDYSRGIGNTS